MSVRAVEQATPRCPMKGNGKKRRMLHRNPFVIAGRFRSSAGPMKAGKRWLHKKIRRESKRVIKEELTNIAGK